MPVCRSLVLEQRIPFRPGQLVDAAHRALDVAGAIGCPARQQSRDEIGDRTADRLIDVELRSRIFLELEILHANHQAGDAVGLVDHQDLLGELDRFVDIAVGNRRDEGAIQQLIVLGISPERRAVEGRGRRCIPFHAGVARGQIAARHRQRLEIVPGRELRRVLGRVVGGLGQNRPRRHQRGKGTNGKSPAIATNG
jgi:hypothetical protein